MQHREVIIEIEIPRLLELDIRVRWKWDWKPFFRKSEYFWKLEWLCFEFAGRH
jgi:hypothetical protein